MLITYIAHHAIETLIEDRRQKVFGWNKRLKLQVVRQKVFGWNFINNTNNNNTLYLFISLNATQSALHDKDEKSITQA